MIRIQTIYNRRLSGPRKVHTTGAAAGVHVQKVSAEETTTIIWNMINRWWPLQWCRYGIWERDNLLDWHVSDGDSCSIGNPSCSHIFSLEDLVALGTSLLILLHFTLEPLLDAIWVEEVLAARNPQDLLVHYEGIYTNHTVTEICKFKLLYVLWIFQFFKLVEELFCILILNLLKLILKLLDFLLGKLSILKLSLNLSDVVYSELVIVPVRVCSRHVVIQWRLSRTEKALAAANDAQATEGKGEKNWKYRVDIRYESWGVCSFNELDLEWRLFDFVDIPAIYLDLGCIIAYV